jgi:hypothetical protein
MRAIHALVLLLALAAPALAADPAQEACDQRVGMLEKRLYFLQQRLAALDHELSSRPGSQSAGEAWRDAAAWQRLRLGMSQADVLGILGAPGRTTAYYGFLRWEYPDALGQRVNFDDRGRLISWGALAR